MAGYRDLTVYKLAREIDREIFQICKSLPQFEEYGLKSQILRSSQSIIANIAEGYGRSKQSSLEYIRFLTIALGSCDETREHLITSQSRGYVADSNLFHSLEDKLDHLGRMLNLLTKKVRQAI
jgi:four helix bundle protein